jgi:hypothetical protein
MKHGLINIDTIREPNSSQKPLKLPRNYPLGNTQNNISMSPHRPGPRLPATRNMGKVMNTSGVRDS